MMIGIGITLVGGGRVGPPAGLLALSNFSRSGSALYRDVSGSWSTAATNEPRYDHDDIGNPVGLRIEPTYRNYVRNTLFSGAVSGVIGSGGAWPTNFTTSGTNTTVTYTVVGLVTRNGLTFLRFRAQATASADGAFYVHWESRDSANPAVAANGETWTSAAFLAVASGDIAAAASVKIGMFERTSAGSGVSSNGANQNKAALAAGATVQGSYTRTLSGGGTVARACPCLTVEMLSGASLDVTFDIAVPNIFKSSTAPSPSLASTTIGSEIASYTLPAARANGAVDIAGYSPKNFIDSVLLQLDDGTQNNRITLRRTNAGGLYATVVKEGVTTLDALIGIWGEGLPAKVFVGWSPSALHVSFSGEPVATHAAAIPAITNARLGSDSAGSGVWGGTISQALLYSRTTTRQATTVFLHDRFARADGPPLVTPGGNYPYVFVPYTVPTSAVREAAIQSGVFICPSAAGESTTGVTASYAGHDLGKIPYRMSARASFTSGVADRGNVTLISNPNGNGAVSQITANSVHVTFTDRSVQFSYFSGGVLTVVSQSSYVLTNDGSTQYQFGWRYIGNSFFVVELPNGAEVMVYSPEAVACLGRYITFEHYWYSDGPVPKIYEVFAQ